VNEPVPLPAERAVDARPAGAVAHDQDVADTCFHDDAARPHPGGAPRGHVSLAEQRFDLMEPRVGLRRLELIRVHPMWLGRRALLWFRQVLPLYGFPGKKTRDAADQSADPAWPTSCRSTQVLAGWPLSVCCPSGRSYAVPHVCARYQRVRGIATDSLAGLGRALAGEGSYPS